MARGARHAGAAPDGSEHRRGRRPGTFKDRHFLEREPHRFLEGMLVAAWAVGIDRIYIYLRDEYAGLRALLAEELDAARGLPASAELKAAARRWRLRLRQESAA